MLSWCSRSNIGCNHRCFAVLGSLRNVGAGEVGIVYAPCGGVQEGTYQKVLTVNPHSVYTIETTRNRSIAAFSVQTSDAEWAELVETNIDPVENAYKVYRTLKVCHRILLYGRSNVNQTIWI